MTNPNKLLSNNVLWADKIKAQDPDFFKQLALQQKPEYLWIGCSDSRIPANEIVGLLPGEMFVHRNIANNVVHTDTNCLSVISYAVEVLKVKHIIVCGHYGCGGVQAALENKSYGIIDNWLSSIRDIYDREKQQFDGINDKQARVNLLCELNVAQQVANVSRIPLVQRAWESGQAVSIHGWIYNLRDGLLKQLTKVINCQNSIPEHYQVN